MQILLYTPDTRANVQWLRLFQTALPEAHIRLWQEGDTAPADFAVVLKPTPAVLQHRHNLKAIFSLAAGVDAILAIPDLPDVPIIRLEDSGMAIQMAEYVTCAVLNYFRSFDEYDEQARHTVWRPFSPRQKSSCTVGILGLGILGSRIAQSLLHFAFPVIGWSRTPKDIAGVQNFVGKDALHPFLRQSNIIVCALPLTTETQDILNLTTLSELPANAYVINIGRGQHIVEQDLLTLIKQRHLSGATLDVFREEPLPPQHPFWKEARIHITPHISACTLPEPSVTQIADKIQLLEQGLPVTGLVRKQLAY